MSRIDHRLGEEGDGSTDAGQDQGDTGSPVDRMESLKRERVADGVQRLDRLVRCSERRTVLRVERDGREITVFVGKPTSGFNFGSGHQISLDPVEATHVAGLLLALAAEVRR